MRNYNMPGTAEKSCGCMPKTAEMPCGHMPKTAEMPCGRMPERSYNKCEFVTAMAYVPWQHLDKLYEMDQALEAGTIFPELNLPFNPKRGACR